MKKYILLPFILAFLASPAFSLINIGLNAGYTTVNMQEANDYLNSLTYQLEISGLNITTDKKLFKDGLYLNLDMNVGLLDILNVGTRAGLLYTFPASSAMEGTFNANVLGMTLNYSGRYTDTLNTLLIPLEAGVTSKWAVPGIDFSVTFGAYAGYGLAVVAETRKIEDTSGGTTYEVPIPYFGGNFMAEGFVSLDYSVAPFVTLSINGGYKCARVPQVKASASALANYTGVNINIAKDMPLRDLDGKDVFFDFSGYNLGIGLNIGF